MEDVVIIAFGTYAIVTAIRFLVGRYDDRIALKSSTKFVLVLVAAAGVALHVNFRSTEEFVKEGLAGAGLATVIHRTHRWLGAMGDLYRLHVINGARRR